MEQEKKTQEIAICRTKIATKTEKKSRSIYLGFVCKMTNLPYFCIQIQYIKFRRNTDRFSVISEKIGKKVEDYRFLFCFPKVKQMEYFFVT
jgi:hypothetical protein